MVRARAPHPQLQGSRAGSTPCTAPARSCSCSSSGRSSSSSVSGLLFFAAAALLRRRHVCRFHPSPACAPTSTSAAQPCSPSVSATSYPRSLAARALIVIESGTGLGFVALVIGYVPVLYTAFSRQQGLRLPCSTRTRRLAPPTLRRTPSPPSHLPAAPGRPRHPPRRVGTLVCRNPRIARLLSPSFATTALSMTISLGSPPSPPSLTRVPC